MLLGEHAVVYGRPCLVTTVGLYVSATASAESAPGDGTLSITTPALRARGEVRQVAIGSIGQSLQPETSFVEAAAMRVLQEADSASSLRIDTDGPPLSYGLGSSSAVTVAVVAACAAALGLELSQRALFDLAYAAVLDAQGKGSGFDVAAAVYGGTLWFETGGAVIEPLAIPELPFLIGYSGAKVSTRRLVDGVERLRQRQSAAVEQIFDTIALLTASARSALLNQHWSELGDLIDLSHGLLDALGVNTLPLSRLIDATRAAGALGAKLSGAGGGDCIFALAPGDLAAPVAGAIRSAGTLVELPLGVPGVQVQQNH
jgi:mevalonate kinase